MRENCLLSIIIISRLDVTLEHSVNLLFLFYRAGDVIVIVIVSERMTDWILLLRHSWVCRTPRQL